MCKVSERTKMLSQVVSACLVVAVVLSSTQAQIKPPVPISVPAPGLFLQSGTPATRVLIEAFLDINCPDSAAIWDDIQKVAAHYHPDDVSVKVLWSPLPYHRNTIISTQGYHAVRALKPEMVIAYITKLFQHVTEWSSAATVNMTETQVLNKLAKYAQEATSIPAATFLHELAKYRDDVIAEWKFAARRTVGGTPWYFVNGIDVGNGQNTYGVWIKFIDGMTQGVGSKQVRSRSEKIPVSTAAIIAKYLDDVKKH